MERLNERMETVENKLEQLDKSVGGTNENVKLVISLLKGNELDKSDGGLIGEHNDLKKRIERLEKFKDRMFWVLITAAGITGLNLFQLLEMVMKLLKR